MIILEPEILLCPHCRGNIHEAASKYICADCGAEIVFQDGVLNLLPKTLDSVKVNEDKIFAANGAANLKFEKRPWLHLTGRQHALNICRFDEELVDKLPSGRFLEVGGETCYLSTIYKSVYPQATVYATDVSINALKNAAIPVSRFFPQQPDIFAAIDAEDLPFKENTFDVVFAMTMIHHLPHPEKMFCEVRRILRPGGIFIAIDHCVPSHFRWLFSKVANDRAQHYGIQEDLISYSRWLEIFRLSSFPLESLQIYTNPAYQSNPLIAVLGRVIHWLPVRVTKRLLPVGVQIIYQKTV